MQSPVAVCDKAVRTLLVDYVVRYSSANCKQTCADMHCSIYRIPEIYYKYGNLIHNLGRFNCTDPKMFWYIPNSESIQFKHIPSTHVKNMYEYRHKALNSEQPDLTADLQVERQIWYVSLVTSDSVPDLQCFGTDMNKIRDFINGVLASALGVYENYRYTYPELLETLELHHEPEQLRLVLRDGRFPEYSHDKFITFQLTRDS